MTPIEIKCILFATFACTVPSAQREQNIKKKKWGKYATPLDYWNKRSAWKGHSLQVSRIAILLALSWLGHCPPTADPDHLPSFLHSCWLSAPCTLLWLFIVLFWLSFDYVVFIRLYCRLCFSADCARLLRGSVLISVWPGPTMHKCL